MKTILHFIQDSDTSGNFPNLARLHCKDRYRVLFASLNEFAPWLQEYIESQGVKCFSCDAKSRKDFPKAMFKLALCLKREKVDIIHTHLFEPSVVGLCASLLARTKYRVMTRHYSDYHTRINKNWHVRIDKICNYLSHKIIGVSKHTSKHVVEIENTLSNKVVTIYNGIDFDCLKTSEDDFKARIRREFAAEDKILILTVGRLHPEKGYKYLFESLPELRSRLRKPFLWLIAGKGSFKKEYKKQIKDSGCEDIVKLIGFRKDVADLMSTADIFVLPSLAEAFGFVFAEALYFGKPVVATNVGGIPEVVANGVDGVLIPPADSAALVNELADLLNDSEKLKSFANKGRQKVFEKFKIEDMVRKYEVVYEDLINGK